MHFASGIVRPPFEAQDEFLQVTSGCSHDACRFCTFYKDAKFAISPREEILADLGELATSNWRYYSRIWLQGADAFALSYDRLVEIAELIHAKLPWVKTIGGFARVSNFKGKSVEQLHHLSELGYSMLTVGIETGDDDLLKQMNKGYDSSFALEQMQKVNEAELTWVGQFLNGLGGRDYGDKSALETARFYNIVPPQLIYCASLTLFKDTPLYQDVLSRKFTEASEVERLRELKTLVKAIETPTMFRAEHISMPVKVAGNLPEDTQRISLELDSAIKNMNEDKLANYRRQIVSL